MSAPGQGAGQDDIFREVLKQQALIRAVLRRCRVPAAHVEDLAQDVLVIAHRKIKEGAFRPPASEKPLPGAVAAWLTGIARNLAKDLRRSLAVHRGIFMDYRITIDPTVPGPQERSIAKNELAILRKVKLSAVQREIVTLTGMGYTAVQIGAALGLVPDTVATHIRRLRAAFRKALKRGSW